MKQILLIAACVCVIAGCNNSNDHSTHRTAAEPKTPVEKLQKEIDDIHIVGMSKMGKLNKLQLRTQAFIDSLSNLPAKSKELSLQLRSQADSLLSELNYADFAMDKWMHEFYGAKDTLKNESARLLEYLNSEKEKAQKVTDAILNSLKKGDEIIK